MSASALQQYTIAVSNPSLYDAAGAAVNFSNGITQSFRDFFSIGSYSNRASFAQNAAFGFREFVNSTLPTNPVYANAIRYAEYCEQQWLKVAASYTNELPEIIRQTEDAKVLQSLENLAKQAGAAVGLIEIGAAWMGGDSYSIGRTSLSVVAGFFAGPSASE